MGSSPQAAGTSSAAQGFTTLAAETQVESLPLQGELPPWLAGSLLRTGPAMFEVGEQSMRHWFDGLAMLHRFTIADGRVSYGNRFLASRAYRAARERGRMAYGEFATDPCRSLFKRVQTLFSRGRALRQRQRQRGPPRRALRGAHRDAAARGVRCAHAGGGRGARPSAPRDSSPRPTRTWTGRAAGLINYAAKLGRSSELPLLRTGPGRLRAAAARLAVRPRAGLHALLRADRTLDRARRVPVRRQPARARAVGAPLHRELPLEA